MQTQKHFPISALAGFHVLSALANIAAADNVSLCEDNDEKSPKAGTVSTSIEGASAA
jgi:hypothetical protein